MNTNSLGQQAHLEVLARLCLLKQMNQQPPQSGRGSEQLTTVEVSPHSYHYSE